MEFRLLGPIEVWAAGRRVPVSSAQQRTLLAVLLLHANRVVPSERLVEQLGIEPSAALQRLYQELLSAGPAVVPRQLPPDIASFTGQEAELAIHAAHRLAGPRRARAPCRAATADGPGISTPTSTAAATTACDHGRRTPLKVPPIARQDWCQRRYESAAHGSLTGG